MELKVTPWNEETEITEEELRNRLADQELKVYRWSSPPDNVFAGHTHGYHKIVYVIKGSIKFEFPTRHKSFTLNPGDRLELPAGTRHSAVAGSGGAICLEAHVY
jgi:quercetin dioxygenase-like cupin family protein